MLDGIPDLTGIVAVLVYETNNVHSLSINCNVIRWVNKKRKVYDPKTQMVQVAYFLRLNMNDS